MLSIIRWFSSYDGVAANVATGGAEVELEGATSPPENDLSSYNLYSLLVLFQSIYLILPILVVMKKIDNTYLFTKMIKNLNNPHNQVDLNLLSLI